MRGKGRLLTGGTVKSRTVVEFALSKGHARDSADDFIVKLSPSVYVAVSFLDQRNGCTKFCFEIKSGSGLGTRLDKSCCHPWFVCHDKIISCACSIRLAP